MQKAVYLIMNEHSDIAEKKILILYFFKIINIPIGSIQFVRIMLENKLMNYFYMQQYLSELIEEELVKVEKNESVSYYLISKKGMDILNMFESILPAGLKKRLKDSVGELKKTLHTKTMITADYLPEGDGYNVMCKIRERDFSLLEVKIAAGTKKDARNICKNWIESSHEIYLEILETMIQDRKKHDDLMDDQISYG